MGNSLHEVSATFAELTRSGLQVPRAELDPVLLAQSIGFRFLGYDGHWIWRASPALQVLPAMTLVGERTCETKEEAAEGALAALYQCLGEYFCQKQADSADRAARALRVQQGIAALLVVRP